MSYVDGYLLPLPRKHLAAYRRIASKAGPIWKEHGALDYKESVLEDQKVKGLVPFPKVSKAKAGETVVFAYIVFKSRKHRDLVNARVMKDPRIHKICDPKKMPFDIKRMAYGGFKVIVDPR